MGTSNDANAKRRELAADPEAKARAAIRWDSCASKRLETHEGHQRAERYRSALRGSRAISGRCPRMIGINQLVSLERRNLPGRGACLPRQPRNPPRASFHFALLGANRVKPCGLDSSNSCPASESWQFTSTALDFRHPPQPGAVKWPPEPGAGRGVSAMSAEGVRPKLPLGSSVPIHKDHLR